MKSWSWVKVGEIAAGILVAGIALGILSRIAR